MKRIYHDFKDGETGKVTSRLCVKFFNGQLWPIEKYNQIEKRRIFRREVIAKHLKLGGKNES